MPGRNWMILAVALVLGLVAVIAANAYFSGVEQRQAQVAAQQRLARIVVASQPLAFGTPLTTANVRMQNWPAQSVPQGAFRSLDQALRNNRVALRPIVPGEPVLADKVSGRDGRATLAANLPEGMRAVSIPIGATTGVSGFVLPGTTVDVMLTRQRPGSEDGADVISDVIMENVQILAIDQLADEKTGKPKVGKTATVQVDLYGAQKLAVAQRLGTLSLALRNIQNQQLAALTTVSARDFGGGLGYVHRPPAPPPAPAPVTIAMPAMLPPMMAPRPAVAAPAPIAPVQTGPSMTVYRGTQSTDYPVGTLGGQ